MVGGSGQRLGDYLATLTQTTQETLLAGSLLAGVMLLGVVPGPLLGLIGASLNHLAAVIK